MARKSGIWFRASRNAWFTKYQGRQIMLGATEAAANAALKELFRAPTTSPVKARTVADLLNAWLRATERHVTPQTQQSYAWTAKAVIASWGKLEASSVTAHHLTAWLDAQNWGRSSRAVYGGHVKIAFRWAADQGLIDAYPFGRLRLGSTERRRPVTEADAAAFRAAIQDAGLLAWWDVAVACGARPGELLGLEARHLSADRSSATVTGKTGQRVIHFPKSVRALLGELARLHPTGPLLRNGFGRVWNRLMLGEHFRRCAARAGVRLVPYHTRHIFATRSLRANGEIVTSLLTGHKNLSTLKKHYIALESSDLDQAIDRVKAG